VMELFAGPDEVADAELVLALRTIGLQVGQFLCRTRAQAERERLVDELRETLRFSELFAGILAHDLRNPLNTIVMGTELLCADAPDPKVQSTLVRMRSSERRMTRMIEQLLDLTRSRSGSGIAIVPSPLDFAELANGVVQELSLAFPSRRVRVNTAGDTRGEWDQDRLGQVVSNLLGNALHHGDERGEVAVSVDGRASRIVELETHNAGAIPAEHLPHLFDPFRSGNRKRRQGLGLGLYITKLIVEAHGGDVRVDSGSTGTRFRVRLPRTSGRGQPGGEHPLA